MNDVVTQVLETKSSVKLVINDDQIFWVSLAIYQEQPLQPNDKLDIDAFKDWLLLRQYPQALHKAVTFLATRARSRQEVEQKLAGFHYMESAIDMALCKLEKENIIDDAAFAKEWVTARMHRQLGKARMMQELLQKGISRQVAETACSLLPDEEMDQAALSLAAKLVKRHALEPDPGKALRKVLAAMGRRGFAFEEANDAIQAALAQMQQE